MAQPIIPESPPRSAADVAAAEDLRSAIAMALAADLIDEDTLRRTVWSFVRAERDADARPGKVIHTLTALVDAAPLGTAPMRHARLRQVILSCVEAYFGHLGGNDVSGAGEPARTARQVSKK